jgi:hypothetical protein
MEISPILIKLGFIIIIFSSCNTNKKETIHLYKNIDFNSWTGLEPAKNTFDYPYFYIYNSKDTSVISAHLNKSKIDNLTFLFKNGQWRSNYSFKDGRIFYYFDMLRSKNNIYSTEYVIENNKKYLKALHVHSFNNLTNYSTKEIRFKDSVEYNSLLLPWEIDTSNKRIVYYYNFEIKKDTFICIESNNKTSKIEKSKYLAQDIKNIMYAYLFPSVAFNNRIEND